MASSNATAWVLQAALQGLAAPSGKDFIAASRFTGAKPGYVYKTGEQGLGYYLDAQQGGAEAADGAAAGATGAGGGSAGDKASGSLAGQAAQQQQQQQQLDPEELLRQAEEEANIDQIQALDAKSLRRLVAGLDKKYKENLALRLKYADQPDRFLDSEVDLDEHIKSLMQVAGSPELYPVLADGPCLPTLLALLSHENTDIAADVVELLAELTGADAAEEYGEEARGLVEGLVEANAPELLVQRLLGFKEDVEEEARAVHNCLAVVENMVEIQPELASAFVDKTKLLTWLLRRLKRRDFDANKQYASEVLAILMQGNVDNQARLGAENGIDLLLTCVAQYKSRDPGPGEEEEYMQNCFDVLCACLMQQAHKAAFVKAEGVELMHLMLQSRRQCRYGALKCLDYAATRFAAPAEKLVDLGGLKQLFGLFMGKAKVKGPMGEHDVDQQVEERCVSLLASLLTQLPSSGRGASRRERLLAKFVESEFEKTDRLMELLFRYQARVRAEEKRLAEALAEADEGEQVDEEELLLARLDAGLFTLQQCCVIFGNLWATGDAGLRRRLLALLHQKGQTLGPVREVLLEYYNSIGEEGGPEEAARSRKHVRGLLEALGAELEEEELRPAADAEAAAAAAPAAPPPLPPSGAAAAGRGQQTAPPAGRAGQEEEEGEAMDLDEGGAPPPPPPPLPDGAMPPPPPPAGGARAPAPSRRKPLDDEDEAAPMPPPPPAAPPAGRAAASGSGPRSHEETRTRGRELGVGNGREEEREEEREREAKSDRGRDRDRERPREKEKEKEKEKEREKDRDARGREEKDKEREKDKEKERGRDKPREKDRDREAERDRDRTRDRDRRESSRRDREGERDEQEYDERRKASGRDRESDRDRELDRERGERGRDRDRDRDRDADRDYDERERVRDRAREKDRDRDRERQRERERGDKDRDRR